MEHKENDKNTLEFIQLVKCIIEYYGTTKSKNKITDNEIKNEIDDKDFIGSIEDFDLSNMSIEIPSDLDSAIKKTFLSQLKKFSNISKKIKS